MHNRSVKGMTAEHICTVVMWRVYQQAVGAEKECNGYDSWMYMHRRNVMSRTAGCRCREVVWGGVTAGCICT